MFLAKCNPFFSVKQAEIFYQINLEIVIINRNLIFFPSNSGLTNCWEMSINNGASSSEPQSPNCTYGVQRERQDRRQTMLERQISSSETLLNVDSELQLLQDRLQFAPNVEPFQLTIPGRHIVYSGELYYVDGWKWVKVWVVLMNDSTDHCR